MTTRTRMSNKGQVVIPKAVRDARRWPAGTDLEVVDRPDGVLLRLVETRVKLPFDEAVARIRALYRHDGPPFSDDDLDAARDRSLGDKWGPRRR